MFAQVRARRHRAAPPRDQVLVAAETDANAWHTYGSKASVANYSALVRSRRLVREQLFQNSTA
jgi:hypothetical protein